MNEKKIGILTYHTGYNYGASLQAYALMTTIKKMGFTCEIINFETERFVASREMFSRKPTRLKECIKIVTRIPYYNSLTKRQALFDTFTSNCLEISPLYRTEQEVIAHACDYDCIVCGSDQIWNLSQDDAPAANPIFFLNFPKTQKRISYAASFGKWVKEAPQHEDIFLSWLKQFDAISVRETSGVAYVRSLGLPCSLCLDPTVLLDAEEYEQICSERLISEKYVLLFSWMCTDDVVEAAKMVARKLNLPLYNIVPPPRAMFKGVKRKLDVGPREFLSMIKNAEFVVTNSFHGTAFSTTFEKPYASIVANKPDLRMKSLLEQLGLESHLVTADQIDINTLLNTDYSKVKEKKEALRRDSLTYLKNALAEV
ncbi:MAG: polysaccharide pyruvyl transferase family protein [Succiniclasticum sp.]|uniref:polysaccharide pyruvyl transferase family protein n=1 Tax=Succiniclasticum sp. TaxID=2775030 RepID=UPI002A90B746|nr:polysaccharide pyruvyl transferase family protein [Succiniclasticum sp.]MDY6291074.1 polysaccharide pyruvyl transferase family protein [Succiniclasticum sp.]